MKITSDILIERGLIAYKQAGGVLNVYKSQCDKLKRISICKDKDRKIIDRANRIFVNKLYTMLEDEIKLIGIDKFNLIQYLIDNGLIGEYFEIKKRDYMYLLEYTMGEYFIKELVTTKKIPFYYYIKQTSPAGVINDIRVATSKYRSQLCSRLEKVSAEDIYTIVSASSDIKLITLFIDNNNKYEKFLKKVLSNKSGSKQSYYQYFAIMESTSKKLKKQILKNIKNYKENKNSLRIIDIYFERALNYYQTEYKKFDCDVAISALKIVNELKVYEDKEACEYMGKKKLPYFNQDNINNVISILEEGDEYYKSFSNFKKYFNPKYINLIILEPQKFLETDDPRFKQLVFDILNSRDYDPALNFFNSLNRGRNDSARVRAFRLEFLNIFKENKLYIVDHNLKIIEPTTIHAEGESNEKRLAIQKEYFENFEKFLTVHASEEYSNIISSYISLGIDYEPQTPGVYCCYNFSQSMIGTKCSSHGTVCCLEIMITEEEYQQLSDEVTLYPSSYFNNLNDIHKEKEAIKFLELISSGVYPKKAFSEDWLKAQMFTELVLRYGQKLNDQQIELCMELSKKYLIEELLNQMKVNLWSDERTQSSGITYYEFEQYLQTWKNGMDVLRRLVSNKKLLEFELREFFKRNNNRYRGVSVYHGLYVLLKQFNLITTDDLTNLYTKTLSLRSSNLLGRRMGIMRLLPVLEQRQLIIKGLSSKKEIEVENTINIMYNVEINIENFEQYIRVDIEKNRTISNAIEALGPKKGDKLLYDYRSVVAKESLIPNYNPTECDKLLAVPAVEVDKYFNEVYEILTDLDSGLFEDLKFENTRDGHGRIIELIKDERFKAITSNFSNAQLLTLMLTDRLKDNEYYKQLSIDVKKELFEFANGKIIENAYKAENRIMTSLELSQLIDVVLYLNRTKIFKWPVNFNAQELDYSQITLGQLIGKLDNLFELANIDNAAYPFLKNIYSKLMYEYFKREYYAGNVLIADVLKEYNANENIGIEVTVLWDLDYEQLDDYKFEVEVQGEVTKLLTKDLSCELKSSRKRGCLVGSEALTTLIKASKIDKGLRNSWLSGEISNLKLYKNEPQFVFDENIKQLNLSEIELIDLALNNLALTVYIANYLEIPMLESIVLFFYAYDSPYGVGYLKDKINKYTSINVEQMKHGRVDKDWFEAIKASLPLETLESIKTRIGNRRASKIYDALMQRTTKLEQAQNINKSRNKDALVAYSLIPPEADANADLIERIQLYRKFEKESKQFGAMRRASEKAVVDACMLNLAKTFGYNDENLFVLQAYSLELDTYQEYFDGVQIDNYVVSLEEKNDKIAIKYESDGKKLKSKPVKIKNEVVPIIEIQKQLNSGYKHLKQNFESLMISQQPIDIETLMKLLDQPILAKFLSNIIYQKAGGEFIILRDGDFYTVENDKVEVDDKNVVIAHVSNIIDADKYFEWKQVVLDNQIVQPFKQLFREAYFKQGEELDEVVSHRYSGYPVKLSTVFGLLSSVGWKFVDGLAYKLYAEHNVRAELYGYNPYFSDDYYEENYLEYIKFFDSKTNEPIEVKNIDNVVYSEIMRDFDLAVTVAYVGEENKELGMTTVDIRKDILSVNQKLFKLDNITVSDHKVYIDGAFGNYLVNLKSGAVKKEGRGDVMIFPVSTKKQKDVYLPYIDKNSKTQEIMSLIIMLSRDNKIRNEEVLNEIRR